MRWERLFEDLEAEWEAAQAAELEAEVRDRTRREHALVALTHRLAPSCGHPVELSCLGLGRVQGRLLDVGADWLLLDAPGQREVLVRSAAVLAVTGLGQRSRATTAVDEVGRRLDLRWALRGLARSRSAVQAVTVDGAVRDGTIDRVGADHVELAGHPPGEDRRAGAVRQVVLLTVAGLAAVRSAPGGGL